MDLVLVVLKSYVSCIGGWGNVVFWRQCLWLVKMLWWAVERLGEIARIIVTSIYEPW